MKWTTDKPTVSGYYWIYIMPEWEDNMQVDCAYAQVIDDKVSFLV
jgi:hypothetical protein